MSTALDIITDALVMLGVYDDVTSIAASDSARGLRELNKMMDSWSNESLSCFALKEQSFVLVPNDGSYTIGPGGQINQQRPISIPEGPGTAFIRDVNLNDYPLEVVPRDKWNLIGLKSNTSDIPDTLFYDPQFPLGIINLFPVPISPFTLFFDSYAQLTDFSTLQQTVSLPPGYELAMAANLAIQLKPFFADGNLDPAIIKIASDSLGNVKRSNLRPTEAIYDPEIVSRTSPTYNVYRDRSNGT